MSLWSSSDNKTQDPSPPAAYDLPSPTRATAVVPPSPTRDLQAKPNGHITDEDEKSRWVDRVGWAPRFGEGTMTEAEKNESLLDKTTALEAVLDDKLFGGEIDAIDHLSLELS